MMSVHCHKISHLGAGLSWVVLCLGYSLDDLGFEFCKGKKIVLFSCTTGLAVVPTVSPVEWVQGFFFVTLQFTPAQYRKPT